MPYTGRLKDRTSYDTFGRVWTSTAPSAESRFAFTGRDLDPESDLYHYRARYYDPATGQFISADPIGFEAGDGNLYRYVGNGPIDGTDPSGKEDPLLYWNEDYLRTDQPESDEEQRDSAELLYEPSRILIGDFYLAEDREIVAWYNEVRTRDLTNDQMVAILILHAIKVMDGNVTDAFALIKRVRDLSNSGDDIWASADHFFNCWTVRDFAPAPVAAYTGELWRNIYALAKMIGIPVKRDKSDIPPSPSTPLQRWWGHRGACTALCYPTDLKSYSEEELIDFVKWILKPPMRIR